MITTQRTAAVVTIGAAAEISASTHQTHSSLFRRLLDTLIESRMWKAEREIREHLNFVSADVLRRAGYRVRRRRSNLGSRLEQRPSELTSGTSAVSSPSFEREVTALEAA
jgi:hypothetical protein